MAPFGLILFIASMGIMEGRSTDSIQDKFRTVSLVARASGPSLVILTHVLLPQMYVPAILANWTIWPFIQIVNFRYMPLAYRVSSSFSLRLSTVRFRPLARTRIDSRTDSCTDSLVSGPFPVILRCSLDPLVRSSSRPFPLVSSFVPPLTPRSSRSSLSFGLPQLESPQLGKGRAGCRRVPWSVSEEFWGRTRVETRRRVALVRRLSLSIAGSPLFPSRCSGRGSISSVNPPRRFTATSYEHTNKSTRARDIRERRWLVTHVMDVRRARPAGYTTYRWDAVIATPLWVRSQARRDGHFEPRRKSEQVASKPSLARRSAQQSELSLNSRFECLWAYLFASTKLR